MAGLRKQELESLTWDDVSFVAGSITVSPKPGFSPKDWEQRTVEVPASLLDLIEPLPAKTAGCFPPGQETATRTCGTTATPLARSRR